MGTEVGSRETGDRVRALRATAVCARRRKAPVCRRQRPSGAAPRSTEGFGPKATRGRSASPLRAAPRLSGRAAHLHLAVIPPQYGRPHGRGHAPSPFALLGRALERAAERAADARLQGLNPAQREAVVSDAAPLCILAGAGSGKTRVLTRRIAWRVREATADPRHVLVVTFTRKAAGELAARLGALGVRDQVASGTFHALAYAQLRRRWADAGQRPPTLLERKVRLLAPVAPVRAQRHRAARRRRHRDRVGQGADDRARALRAGGRRSPARRPPLPAGAIASIYERYEDEKRRRGLVDFDDLLLLCARALETDREFAAGQRWRFRHLFVDEFQDVNPAQFRLLQGWRGDRADLCVVGDPNQAIFSWNGADAGFLTGFPRALPRRRPSCASTTTTARRPRSWRWPTPCSATTPGCAPTGPTGRRRR